MTKVVGTKAGAAVDFDVPTEDSSEADHVRGIGGVDWSIEIKATSLGTLGPVSDGAETCVVAACCDRPLRTSFYTSTRMASG